MPEIAGAQAPAHSLFAPLACASFQGGQEAGEFWRKRDVMLSARENALRILRFAAPERVTTAMPGFTIGYFGVNHESFDGGGHHLPVGSTWTDIWGTVWEKEHPDVMGFPRGCPLADPAALRAYDWPDPDDARLVAPIYAHAPERPDETFLCGSHRDTLWEKAYMLVGMERMMANFYDEPAFVREVLHRIMDFQLGIARHYLAVGVEMVAMSDDLGTQQGPLLSPWIVDEFLMPEYRRLFDLYRAAGVIIHFHSCGQVEWALERFMDLGVDCLNPVQASANDLARVRARTQGRMALQGGISTGVIMEGPPSRIRDAVRDALWTLGRDGGYFCGPDQGMPFPPAHLEAFHDALATFGTYPLVDAERARCA